MAIAALLLCGCAVPYRYSLSQHEVVSYAGARAGQVLQKETWTEIEKGGGNFFLCGDNTSNICVWHTNMAAMGGGSYFRGSGLSLDVSTNSAPLVNASGGAVGDIIGAAVKTAAPVPKLP